MAGISATGLLRLASKMEIGGGVRRSGSSADLTGRRPSTGADGNTTISQPSDRRSWSLLHHLVVLILAIVVPLILFFGGVSYFNFMEDRARAGQRTLDITRGLMQTVEAELQARISGLQGLGVSRALQRGDFEGFRPQAEAFLALHPGANIAVADEAGRLLFANGAGISQVQPGTLRANRESVDHVFRTGQPVVSNLFTGAVSRRLGFTVDVPVFQDRQVIYVLSMNPFSESMTHVLERQRLPPAWVVSIFDRTGVIVARIPNGDVFISKPASASLLPRLSTKSEGILPTISLEGTLLLTAFTHSQLSGWSVAIGVPEAELLGPLWRSLGWTCLVGSATLLLSFILALLLSRRVLRPMRMLGRLAMEPDAEVGQMRLGLREADAAISALRAAAARRRATEDELRQLAGTLEARVRAEVTAREQAQAQLAHGQRLEALGQLAGGMAHDFNNVLQGVSGGLELILKRATDVTFVSRATRMCMDTINRGASITSRLLTFSRRSELQATPVLPHPLLENLHAMLAPILGGDIAIRTAAPANLPPLLADRGQLETTLVNLAVNARDAMPSGGTLTLAATLELTPKEPPPAGLAAGAYIRVDIMDTGLGMDAPTLARAGEPFFTTKPPGKGTGLGLAMARGLAEQSGGGFRIQSTPNQGTVVTLWFPVARHQEGSMEDEPVFEPRDLGLMRVLLADDDDMVRTVLATQLEDEGYRITQAASGLIAVSQMEAGEKPDLLITDYAMPGMNGLMLIEEARKRYPKLPAILLTGYADVSVQLAFEKRVDSNTELVRKPISGETLALRATTLLSAAPGLS